MSSRVKYRLSLPPIPTSGNRPKSKSTLSVFAFSTAIRPSRLLRFNLQDVAGALALEQAMSEDVIATCDEIDAEIVRVLTEKFSWEQHRATSALQAILGAWHPCKNSRHGKGMP